MNRVYVLLVHNETTYIHIYIYRTYNKNDSTQFDL